MKYPKTILRILLIASIGLTACAKTRTAQLSDQAESFNESIRWSSIKAASTYMSEKNRRTLVEKYSRDFQKWSNVDFSILDIGLSPSKKNATVLVEFSAYDNSTQDLSYRQEIQTWDFEVAKQSWVVSDTRPVSKDNH